MTSGSPRCRGPSSLIIFPFFYFRAEPKSTKNSPKTGQTNFQLLKGHGRVKMPYFVPSSLPRQQSQSDWTIALFDPFLLRLREDTKIHCGSCQLYMGSAESATIDNSLGFRGIRAVPRIRSLSLGAVRLNSLLPAVPRRTMMATRVRLASPTMVTEYAS